MEASDNTPLLTALGDLRQVIAACDFALSADQAASRRRERDQLRREIEALEQRGLEIRRFAIRAWPVALVDLRK